MKENKETKIHTNGDVCVDDIKIGDTIYEYGYGHFMVSEVISLPKRNDDGLWEWKGKTPKSGVIVDFGVHEKYSHYAPKLYWQPSYSGCKLIE